MADHRTTTHATEEACNGIGNALSHALSGCAATLASNFTHQIEGEQAFNKADADLVSGFYTDDAVNHQVPNRKVVGRDAIHAMFREEFAQAEMVCIVENIFQDGDWAILEWKDPFGLRGCGFFQMENGKIKLQRGYWDKLSFLKMHGLPIE